MAGTLAPVLQELHNASTDPEEQKYYSLIRLIFTEDELPMNQGALNALFRRNSIPQRNGVEVHIGAEAFVPFAFDLKDKLAQFETLYPDVNLQRSILSVAIEKLTGEGQKTFENRAVKFLEFLRLFLRKQYTPQQIAQILDNIQLYTYLLTYNKDWRNSIPKQNRNNRANLFNSYSTNKSPFIELLATLYEQDKQHMELNDAQTRLQDRLFAHIPNYNASKSDIVKEILREYIGDDVNTMNLTSSEEDVEIQDPTGNRCMRSIAKEYTCPSTGKKYNLCPETIKLYGPTENDPEPSLPKICHHFTQDGGRRRRTRKRARRSKKTRRT